MAKNDKKNTETEVTEATSDATVDTTSAEAESTEGLVKMHKDGTHLHVHPTTVEAHKAVGWTHA